MSDVLRAKAEAFDEIASILDEPLDERDGHGPTRNSQFLRIDRIITDLRQHFAQPHTHRDPTTGRTKVYDEHGNLIGEQG